VANQFSSTSGFSGKLIKASNKSPVPLPEILARYNTL
jgi:hypothetical protein